MKKSLIIAGVIVLIGVAALLFNLNKRDGSKASVQQTTAQQTQESDKPSKSRNPSKDETKAPSPKANVDAIPALTKEQRVDSLLQQSHIREQVDLLAEFFRTGLDTLDPAERKVLEPLFEKALQSAVVNYRNALLDKFSDRELETLSAIYSDPQFEQFNAEAIQNAKDQDSEQMTKRLLTFDAAKLPTDRREALLEIADAELKVGFLDMGKEQEEFKQRLKESFLGRLDILTEGKSVEDIKHIASKINEPLVIEQRKLQMQVFEDSMKVIEDAALENAIGQ